MSTFSEEKASAAAASPAPHATSPRAAATAAAADAAGRSDTPAAANATANATAASATAASATAASATAASAIAASATAADAAADAVGDATAANAAAANAAAANAAAAAGSREEGTVGAVCDAGESTEQGKEVKKKSEEERSKSSSSRKRSSSMKREEENGSKSSVVVDSSKREESSSQTASEDSSNLIACEGCGVQVKPVLACPSCVKLRIKQSYFCNQDCFKANWKRHKEVHAVMQQLMAQQQQQQSAARAAADDKESAATTQLQKRQPVDWSKPFDAADPSTWEGDVYLPRFLNFRFTGPLRPWRTREARRRIPPGVHTPDYASTGTPYSEEAERGRAVKIHVHSEEEIERVRAACALGREALDYAHGLVEPGVTTEEIDEKVHDFIVSRGGYPSPLNYCGFPKSCCTSVNEVICHGIPNTRPLEKGDLLNIDITVYYRGMHGDLNETYVVGGETDEDSKRLLQGAYLCLAEAIKRCRPGVMYRHVGQFVSEVAEKYRLSVVRSYCGHGIGALFHTRPNVPHYANNKAPATMKPGHIFTIEPMLNLGKWNDVLWPDRWTACTADGKRSAQFEHTLLVTKTGVEVLTHRRTDSPPLDCDTHGSDFP